MSSMDKVTATNAVGSLEVIRPLYARGTVHIYLCEQKSTNQLVVLKHNRRKNAVLSESTTSRRVVVPRDASHDTTPLVLDMTADSIDQELLVARLIQTHGGHRHVINYLNVPTSKRQDTYVIMEYCRRGDLFTLLEQQPTQRFEEATALHFFHQIIQGLHFLHQCVGIAHRDLSLENVLVDEQWCLKICDFGLSTMVTRRCNETVGKLFYMAPEIVAGQVYDPIQADIWSLGILLFIMLTGSPLYQIADPSDPGWNAVQRLGIGGLLKHWGLEHHISTPTITLLTSMLQVHPSRRLHSLEGVEQHLVTYGH